MPSNQDNLISQIFDSMQNSIDSVEKSIPSIEKAIFDELSVEVSKLETVNGNIKTSVSNLKQVQKVKSKLNSIILNDNYKQDVNTYLNSFNDTKTLIDSYFSTIVSDFNGKSELFKAILSNSVEVTTESLLGAGVSNDIITPISDYLSKSVTSGSNLTELIQNLKIKIIGDSENLGYLMKNVKQIATDSLNQYSANYIKTVSDDLGLKWFKYQGGKKSSSRCFCLERVDKYWYISEVQHWGETPSLWNTCKTKLHKGGGRINGTDATTIFTYRGGWQCNHQIIPVSERNVPKKDLDRFIKKEEPIVKELSNNQSIVKKQAEDIVGANINKKAFKFINDDMVVIQGDAHINPTNTKIAFGNINDDSYRKLATAYHELGHSTHISTKQCYLERNKMMYSKEYGDLMDLAKKELRTLDVDKILLDIDREIYKEMMQTKEISPKLWDKFAFKDAVCDLKKGVKGVDGGHTQVYYKQLHGMETFAHLNENYFIGNDTFKEYLPKTYEAGLKYLKNLYGE